MAIRRLLIAAPGLLALLVAAACTLTLHPHAPLTARFIPAVVSSTGQPAVQHGAAARRAIARYDRLRACAGLAASRDR